MSFLEQNSGTESAGFVELRLGGGWAGRVALRDSAGNVFSGDDWAVCLSRPGELCNEPVKTLKDGADTTVVVKRLEVGGRSIAVVIKSMRKARGARSFCRSLLRTKAHRNFNTAVKLCENDIPAAWPLASLRFKSSESIYISEYIENGTDLYSFLMDNLPAGGGQRQMLKRQLSQEVGGILASLHTAGLWHRDAKASNFIVTQQETGQYRVMLVDMDGIKRYGPRRRRCRFRSLAKLASTLLWHGGIGTTDYLRIFTIYCNLSGLEVSQRREAFGEISHNAIALRLLNMADAAMESDDR